jgi:membrane-associated phospholipid phosphatase
LLPRPRLLVVAAALALASAASIAWLDEPLARWIHAQGRALVPFWLASTDAFDAVSGNNTWRWFAGAVFVVAGLVASALPRLRGHAATLWFVAATHLASRISVNVGKSVFARLRPVQWLERGQPAHSFFAGGISFPSGHVTYYLSLCLPLALASPRWRGVWLAVPVFIGCARIGAEQHFLGDTLAAAAWVTALTWILREGFARRTRA